MPTLDQMNKFLTKDLHDALQWLFIGAVVWQAVESKTERCCHQRALGMFTSLVQARALYEFYYADTKHKKRDDARASDFGFSAIPISTLYDNYMRRGKPANKRVFHLVYGRGTAAYAGGPGHIGPGHINKKVLEFAKDLQGITEQFARRADPQFKRRVQSALRRALTKAEGAARILETSSPS